MVNLEIYAMVNYFNLRHGELLIYAMVNYEDAETLSKVILFQHMLKCNKKNTM
jgi:hypothetical protein